MNIFTFVRFYRYYFKKDERIYYLLNPDYNKFRYILYPPLIIMGFACVLFILINTTWSIILTGVIAAFIVLHLTICHSMNERAEAYYHRLQEEQLKKFRVMQDAINKAKQEQEEEDEIPRKQWDEFFETVDVTQEFKNRQQEDEERAWRETWERLKEFQEEMDMRIDAFQRQQEYNNIPLHVRQAYRILDLSYTTDPSVIKSRYRELIKIHHPDKGGKAEDFIRIKKAKQQIDEHLKELVH